MSARRRWPWILPLVPIAVTAFWVVQQLPAARAEASPSSTEAVAAPTAAGPAKPEYGAAHDGAAAAAATDSDTTLASTARPLARTPAEARRRLPPAPPRRRHEVNELFYGSRSGKRVALTFDDGPSRENTPRILRVLERMNARATFFVLGRRAAKMPSLVEKIGAAGHDVGNHTWSHGSMRSMFHSQIRDELADTNAAVAGAIGRHPALFRPPFGRYAPSAVPIVAEFEMHVVLWSVDSHDWEEDDPSVVARNVVGSVTPGSIVLLHDRKPVTAHALPAIIDGLRRRGFEIVPVSELAGLPAYASSPAGP